MGSQGKEYASLLFTPRTAEKQSDGQRSRSPHSTRSPSIAAYGRSSVREGSATRRRSLTPTGSRETPPPPPPALSLLDASRGATTTAGPLELTGSETLALQQYESTSYGEASEETWVTVYGFNFEDQAIVLREFSKCGDILRFGNGREDRVNWVHLNYANKYQAQRALLKDGQVLGGRLMVGVKRLEGRHRDAADALSRPTADAALRVTAAPAAVRPHKLASASMQGALPQQSTTMWSKLNEFVFGL